MWVHNAQNWFKSTFNGVEIGLIIMVMAGAVILTFLILWILSLFE